MASDDDVIPGRYIVVLKDAVDNPGAVARAQVADHSGDLVAVYRHALKGYAASVPGDGVMATLRRDPRVAFVTRDHRVSITATVPTGVERTFASTNPDLDMDGIDDMRTNADVAIIDTGIDYQHEDLDVVFRTNCVTGTCVDNSGLDGNGHGTHVAGTAGAIDNSVGVVGTASGARLWAVKSFNDSGTASEAAIIAGLNWVAAHGGDIEVVNMSFVCNCSSAVDTALNGVAQAGIVPVAAAGNGNQNAQNQRPANHPYVIAVSAIADYDGQPGGLSSWTCLNGGLDDRRWKNSFDSQGSNYGAVVDIAAPGVCIYSTEPGDLYGNRTGTSIAAPHVAGAAAVLASYVDPNSLADVQNIRSTLISEGNSGWTDTSPDGIREPLLDLGDPAVFGLGLLPPPICDPLSSSRVKIGDMNGDGKADIFRFTDPPDGVGAGHVWRSNGASFTALGQVGTGFGIAYQDRIVDRDGDGDDDILQFTEAGRVDAWRSNGTSYTPLSQVGWSFPHPCEMRIGDMNGDGLDDIFRFSNDGVGYLWLATPTGNTYQGEIGTGFGLSRQVRFADMDGDGDDDIITILDNGNAYAWRSDTNSYTSVGLIGSGFGNAAQLRVGDRDGDGDEDLFQFTDAGNGYYWRSNGTNYTSLGIFTSGFGPARQVRIADINADSKADILWFFDNGTGYAWHGDGTGFTSLGQIGSGFGTP